jgi:IS5 family transposase
VTEKNGIPLAFVADAANVPETVLGPQALLMLAVLLPWLNWSPDAPTPVLADKAYDSDPLREYLAKIGFVLVSPHRKNRVRPATSDGRRMRRYARRWRIERFLELPRQRHGPILPTLPLPHRYLMPVEIDIHHAQFARLAHAQSPAI